MGLAAHAMARAASWIGWASRSHGLRAGVRWPVWCVLIALAVLGASPAHAEAPMCDRAGASVDALPEVPMADGGTLQELPCGPAVDEMLARLAEAVEPRHHGKLELDTHPPRGVWVATAIVPLAPAGEPLAWVGARGLGPLRGHPRAVYRPPLAG